MSGHWFRLCIAVALSVALPLAKAETDPPGRVGRISLATEGTRLRIGDNLATGAAALNWPLTTGAVIETSRDARAEARIGSTTLRLDGGSSVEFAEIGDERIWLRLNRGNVILEIRSPEHAAGLVLDAPPARIRFDAAGTYRSDAAGGTTAVSAYSGTARIEDPALAVRAGNRILLLGGTGREYLLGQAANDAFWQWSLAQADGRGASRHVPPEMTGQEELDRHGIWSETTEYGPVWYPRNLPEDWAPYRWGHWAWIPPWGWTWIDRSPWGFAPFHYGRWALIGGRWAWLPGAYAARPVYAPALVVWLGRPGWNATFTFGSSPAVGWYPLGPREAYYPRYRCSTQHVRSLNVTHVVNIARIESAKPPPDEHDHHVHRRRLEAVTIVPEKTLKSGTPIDRTAFLRDPLAVAAAPAHETPPPGKPLDLGRASPAAPLPHAGSLPSQTKPQPPAHPAAWIETPLRHPADLPAATARTHPAAEPVMPARPSFQAPEHRVEPPSAHSVPRQQPAGMEGGRQQDFRAERMPKENMPNKEREKALREQRSKQGGPDR